MKLPRVLMSPMAGITDLAFRRLARRYGCEMAYCEMVKDRPVVEGGPRTLDILRTAPDDHPLGMQLAGREPEMMAAAARRLEALGADVVDVNLGCPVSKIVSQGCGSALLKEPDQVGRIVEAMVKAVRVPVTVKIRTGFDEGDDDRFLRVVKRACEAGAAAIAAHGRTREQKFKGAANLESIRRVKEAVTCPVIGNGNIRSGADAVEMVRATGCDAVMVARGALGNPWLYREVQAALDGRPLPPAPTERDRGAAMMEQYDLLEELYGAERAPVLARKFVHFTVKGRPGSAEIRERGNRVASRADFEALVREFEGVIESARPGPIPA